MVITKTSEATNIYNCFAWAAGKARNDEWWAPIGGEYWPSEVDRDETMEAYVNAYHQVGFHVTDNETFEEGFVKIAIYVDANRKPLHAARQLNKYEWTSKIGQMEDVKHEFLTDFNIAMNGISINYGRCEVIMKRKKENYD